MSKVLRSVKLGVKSSNNIFMSDYPIKVQVLNISLNLSRMGEWMAVDFEGKKGLIERFRAQTSQLIEAANQIKMSNNFEQTWRTFENKYQKISFDEKNKLLSSERLLAWANILQHRSGSL